MPEGALHHPPTARVAAGPRRATSWATVDGGPDPPLQAPSTEGLRVPARARPTCGGIEGGPRRRTFGCLSCAPDGSSKGPRARAQCAIPPFVHKPAGLLLRAWTEATYIAEHDPPTLAMLDPILGGIDR